MKHSLTLGLVIATISTAAMATTTAPVAPAHPAPAGDSMMMQKPMGMQGQGGGMAMHGGMDNHMERMWKEMDANGDGSISSDESAAFGKKKFDERDTNKDGKVSREEWDAFGAAKREEMMKKHEERMKEKGEVLPNAVPPADGKPPLVPMEKAGAPIEKK